jgi:MYXO-CTERM domain-containing protein
MSRLLSTVTGPGEATQSNQGTEQSPAPGTETSSGGSGGSRRRKLGLAAAGLGAAYALRRRRSGSQSSESETSATGTTGELGAAESTGGPADESGGRRFGGRLTKTVAGIAASVAARRAIRRWRKR